MNEPLKALEELGEQFERLAYRRRRPRRSRVLVLAIVGTLVGGAAAIAATGLLSGEPVRDPVGFVADANSGVGKPLRGTAALLDLRVPDPDGGPPWGMRFIRTTRGLGCVQIGRVVDERLGVLGQDGAFADDGRFHELPPHVLTRSQCGQPDGAGNVFLAVSHQGVPASGLYGTCRMSAQPQPPADLRRPRARGAQPPACRRSSERIVYFGLLGPRARSVTYVGDAGRHVTRPVARTHGAYLVVLRPTPKHPARGTYVPTTSPGSGLRSVQYSGARTCRIRSPRSLGGAKLCPLVGYVAPRRPHISTAQVAAPVRARFAPRPVAAPTADAPPGARVPRQWKLTITFRARLPGDAQSLYVITAQFPRGARCKAGVLTGPVTHNVAAGDLIRETIYVPAVCRGTVRGRVSYRPRPAQPDPMPFAVTGAGGLTVGRFAARTPR